MIEFEEVFVIHGRNKKIRDSMYSFLRAVGLKPVTFKEAKRRTGLGSPTIMDILDKAINEKMVILSLYTPDDIGYMNPFFHEDRDSEIEKRPVGQARQNIVFETALALARNPKKSILVFFGEVKKYSDISWIHHVHFSDTAESREDLRNLLGSIGCPINENLNYKDAGDFKLEPEIITNLPSTPFFTSKEAELINIIKSIEILSMKIVRKDASDQEKKDFNFMIEYIHRVPKIAAFLPRFITKETDAYSLHKFFKEMGGYNERIVKIEKEFSKFYENIKKNKLLNI